MSRTQFRERAKHVRLLQPVSIFPFFPKLRRYQPWLTWANSSHDVSWGTKGSDKADVLPSLSSKKGKDDAPAVVEDIEKVQEDIDAAFQETVDRAVKKLEVKEEIEKPNMDVRALSPFLNTGY